MPSPGPYARSRPSAAGGTEDTASGLTATVRPRHHRVIIVQWPGTLRLRCLSGESRVLRPDKRCLLQRGALVGCPPGILDMP